MIIKYVYIYYLQGGQTARKMAEDQNKKYIVGVIKDAEKVM